MQGESQLYGIDWNGPVTDGEENEVIVPETFCPLIDDNDVEDLMNSISPAASSIDYGIDLYLATVAFVENRV